MLPLDFVDVDGDADDADWLLVLLVAATVAVAMVGLTTLTEGWRPMFGDIMGE